MKSINLATYSGLIFLLGLGACSHHVTIPTDIHLNATEANAKPQVFSSPVEDKTPPYRVVTFGWRCNADGGYYSSSCYDYKISPDPGSGVIPSGWIQCKTVPQFTKRDPNTSAGWGIGRSDKDVLFYRYFIRANSSLFGPGREIEVIYTHYIVQRSDKDIAGPALGCDFATNGGDNFP